MHSRNSPHCWTLRMALLQSQPSGPRLNGGQPLSLITAQRVYLNVLSARQAEQLRQWAAILQPDGKLIVDIGHPRRDLSMISIGARTCSLGAMRPRFERFFRLADDQTFEECRQYARTLAARAHLQITNAMPPQLPKSVEDVLVRRVFPLFRVALLLCVVSGVVAIVISMLEIRLVSRLRHKTLACLSTSDVPSYPPG